MVLTSTCERVDFVVESESSVSSSPGIRRIAVFDRPTDPSHRPDRSSGASKLNDRHRALLEGLPVPQADRDSVVRAHRAAVDLFENEAPAVAEQAGVPWPSALHEAVSGYRQRCYPPDWGGLTVRRSVRTRAR